MNAAVALTSLAMTIAQEAGGESFAGKLAVGHVVMNRSELWKRTVTDVIFKAYQFSAWLTGSATLIHMDEVTDATWQECFAAACGAYFRALLGTNDPSGGATHYLNVEVTRELRGGSLPDWYDSDKVTVVIDRHTFLKL